jgi:hypothetical protein
MAIKNPGFLYIKVTVYKFIDKVTQYDSTWVLKKRDDCCQFSGKAALV